MRGGQRKSRTMVNADRAATVFAASHADEITPRHACSSTSPAACTAALLLRALAALVGCYALPSFASSRSSCSARISAGVEPTCLLLPPMPVETTKIFPAIQ